MAGEVKSVHSNTLGSVRLGDGQAPRAERRPAAQTKTDSISITNTAVNLGNIERTLAQIPVVDGARVDAIRESIGEGSYVVDSVRVADNLLEVELMLNRAEHASGQF
jgi:negative regulator of flagellin synthesis FlgM